MFFTVQYNWTNSHIFFKSLIVIRINVNTLRTFAILSFEANFLFNYRRMWRPEDNLCSCCYPSTMRFRASDSTTQACVWDLLRHLTFQPGWAWTRQLAQWRCSGCPEDADLTVGCTGPAGLGRLTSQMHKRKEG